MRKPRRLAALLAITGLIGAHAGPPAAAQDRRLPDNVEVVASVWCDTPDQLETVMRSHLTDKVPIGEALAEINRDSPEACILARAIVTLGEEVRRVTAGDTIMSLRSANVIGIMRGRYAMMMRPQTWYCVRVVAELVPL